MTEDMREYLAIEAELAPNPYDACVPMFGHCAEAIVYPAAHPDVRCSAPVFTPRRWWIAHLGTRSVAILAS